MLEIRTVEASSETQLAPYLQNAAEPIVFRGLASDWPLVQQSVQGKAKLTQYLLSFYQGMQIGAGKVEDKANGRLFYKEDFNGFNFSRETKDFGQFLDEANAEGEQVHYMGSTAIDRLLPGLRTENPVAELDNINALASIWVSNQAKIAAHQDTPDNLAICAAGRRKFLLFPPEQVSNLYIGPLDFTPAGQPISLVNHQFPDFELHPKYKDALKHAIEIELAPGDALFVPSLWWHAVEGLEKVNVLINYWWQDTPMHLGSPMDALMHSVMNISQLPPHKKQAMKALFDHYVFNNEEQTHIPEQAQGILNTKDELAVRKTRSQLLNKLNR